MCDDNTNGCEGDSLLTDTSIRQTGSIVGSVFCVLGEVVYWYRCSSACLKKIKKQQQQQQQQQNTVKRTPGVCPCLSLLLLVASFLDGQLGKTET